jgi:iron(III) transport system substrate-binding protein
MWGGTGDPHLQAAEEGLTDEYKSPMLKELQPWAVKQAEQSKFRTVGIYAGALGFGYNTELLARRKLPEPKCWSDPLSEKYKDEVQVADPNSSGTSYTMLATMVQIYGEDKGFDYLKRLHRNINQYTKSGAAPAKATASGETLIGITFQHDLVTFASQGSPIKVVAPCEGTGYEVGSMSIIKGGKNPKEARTWYDWALTADAQSIGAEAKAFQVPSNRNAKVPPQAPRLETIKLIDYDFAKYGSSAERKRLLSKWDKEVKALPK